jgi:hypothetical protein
MYLWDLYRQNGLKNFFLRNLFFHRSSHFCPLTSEDDIEQVRASILHSLKKSAGTAAKELSVLKTTMWTVLH